MVSYWPWLSVVQRSAQDDSDKVPEGARRKAGVSVRVTFMYYGLAGDGQISAERTRRFTQQVMLKILGSLILFCSRLFSLLVGGLVVIRLDLSGVSRAFLMFVLRIAIVFMVCFVVLREKGACGRV